MKIYSSHGCDTKHRTYRGTVECMLPDAAWVAGEGRFAVIAWCGITTVSLHRDLEKTEAALTFINKTRCGGQCERNHEIVLIEFAARNKAEVVK